ncbi:MAG TPA: site-specific integrase, partial [Pyrinomonadaceae bacterium]
MIEQLLEQFFEHLRYERNVSEHTLRNYMSDLLQFLDYLAPADGQTGLRREVDIRQIDHITIREWLSSLHAAQKKKTSVARKLAALRTFFQFLVREGVVEMNPAKLVSSPRLEKKLPNHLSIEDAVRFIETPDTETDLGRRDRAILELLYATGVRVSELTRLDIGDIDFRGKLLRVTGKRRKQRIVPFGDPALHTLLNYLTVRNNFLQHAPLAERETDALFLNYQGTRITTRSVGRMV